MHRNHVIKRLFIYPSLILPIFGQAYSRACEYTCDLHGLACAGDIKNAQNAIAVLAAGQTYWRKINIEAFNKQVQLTGKFWMSFNELTSSHPWLTNRSLYAESAALNEKCKFPRRSIFAIFFALFVPNFFRSNILNFISLIYLIIFIPINIHIWHNIEKYKAGISSIGQSSEVMHKSIL